MRAKLTYGDTLNGCRGRAARVRGLDQLLAHRFERSEADSGRQHATSGFIGLLNFGLELLGFLNPTSCDQERGEPVTVERQVLLAS
jgi:hypothetical protein